MMNVFITLLIVILGAGGILFYMFNYKPRGQAKVKDLYAEGLDLLIGGKRKAAYQNFKNIIDDVNFNGVYNQFNSWWCRKDLELINSLKKDSSIRKNIESINFLNSIIIISKF